MRTSLSAACTEPLDLSRDTTAWRAVAPAIALSAWGGNHFTPLLLLYRQVEGYSALQVDLLLAFYIVGLVPGFLLSGRISEKYGSKPLLMTALVMGVAASIILAAAPGDLMTLCIGRVIAGLSVSVAMVVGTSWIKRLSSPPWARSDNPGTGARRASITLTLGLGVGAGASGALAQWGPAPTITPYLLQIALSIIAGVVLAKAPGSRGPVHQRSSSARLPLLAPAQRRRFLGVVLPLAPWVFSSAALSYAVTPELLGNHVQYDRIGFATLLTVITLGVGTAIQPFTRQIAAATHHHNALIGLELAAAGTIVCALNADQPSLPLATVGSVLFGLSFGICMVSGLVEIQRMVRPDALPVLTGIFYCLTYVGFALPLLLAGLSTFISYSRLLLFVALAALLCAVVVAINLNRTKDPLSTTTGSTDPEEPVGRGLFVDNAQAPTSQ